MATPDPDEIRDTPDALPALARDLRSVARSGPGTPEDRDAAIRAEIHRHFRSHRGEAPPRWRSPAARRFVTWPALAAAAALALAVGLWQFGPWSSSAPPARNAAPRATVARDLADVDRNGRVDILDALALARRLEDGASVEPGLDLNGDGGVDRLDVDAIAARAVSLNGRAG